MDTVEDSGLGSLRQTIEQAQSGDEIRFNSALDGQTIALQNGQLDIDKALTIDASNLPNKVTLDAERRSRHLSITDDNPGEGIKIIIVGVIFVNGNVTFEDGGAIENSENLELKGCAFISNLGANGGAIANQEGSSASINECLFETNSSPLAGGAIYSRDATISISRSDFYRNNANTGGAVYISSSTTEISGCAFERDNAAGGGAVYSVSSSPRVTNCAFNGTVAAFGGAIYCIQSRPTLINCAFALNFASAFGGVLYNSVESEARFLNCTLVSNTASDQGGGIYNIESTSIARNCIFWGNSSDVEGAPLSDTSGYNLIEGIEGAQDPLFLRTPNPINRDYGDLRLAENSPAIDGGDYAAYSANSGPAFDLNGSIRSFDDPDVENTGIGQLGYLDIGAYERSPNAFEMWGDENGFPREALYEDSTPISLLERFAYGLSPDDPASPLRFEDNEFQRQGVPMAVRDASESKIYYYHTRRIDFASIGLTYSLQTSSDLKIWSTITPNLQVLASNESIEIVCYEIASEDASAYLRLRIAID